MHNLFIKVSMMFVLSELLIGCSSVRPVSMQQAHEERDDWNRNKHERLQTIKSEEDLKLFNKVDDYHNEGFIYIPVK